MISINLGESFMAVEEDAEGLFEMYLFKPCSGLDAVGVYRGLPPPTSPSLFFK